MSSAETQINVSSSPNNMRPTALEIIRREGLEDKLTNKVMVITGATSGIGLETARALAATGATLFLTTHDDKEQKNAESSLHDILGSGRVSFVRMNLASFASVRRAVANILLKANNQVNILVNNAGVFGFRELRLSEDGYETHFATNYLGHFLLFQLLKDALITSSTPGFCSRVVAVSSSAHRSLILNPSDNYDFQKGGYNHDVAYANSKLAITYMVNQIDRLYGKQGLHATSLHPGGVNTSLSRHLGQEFVDRIMSDERLVKMLKSPEEGAATTVIAAVGKDWEGRGGKYLEDCKEAIRGEDDSLAFGTGYVRQTYDPLNEERLWKDSLAMVGMSLGP